MRINEPVTQKEAEFKDGIMLVSRTDMGGRIVDVNDAFVAISGFTREELIGQPHNIIRHPDMPPEAFDDMWRDIKAGKPWSGYVKNRCKNGDYYWVMASAAPIVENGEMKGFISIRSKPSRAAIATVGAAYRQFRDGSAKGLAILHGRVVRNSLFARLGRKLDTLNARIVGLAAVLCLIIGTVGYTGIHFNKQTGESLKTVYLDRTAPAGQLADISRFMHQNVISLQAMIGADETGKQELMGVVEGNIQSITKIWGDYMATYLTPEEKVLAENYAAQRKQFVTEGLKVGLEMAKTGRDGEIAEHLKTVAMPLFKTAAETNSALIALQLRVAEEEFKKGEANYANGFRLSVASLVLGILIAFLGGMVLRKTMLGRLSYLEDCLDQISKGNLNVEVKDGDDEIGRVLTVLKSMQAKLAYAGYERAESERQAQERARNERNNLADDFEKNVKAIVDSVISSSGEMKKTASTMSGAAQKAAEQSNTVAAASEEATANVQTVSAATEELTASIREIEQRIAASSEKVEQAVAQTRAADEKVRGLTEAASKVGTVVSLISDIAEQTNLLALNATIEAARAGDAGKGFAVVASEVKTLATQTSKATEEISQQIREIQEATRESADSIRKITAEIGEISHLSSAIAAAIVEQGSATQEISRNVSEAAQGTKQVTTNIIDVSSAAQQTGASANQVLSAANDLAEKGMDLEKRVSNFIRGIRG